MYKLFTGKASTAVLRVQIALNLKGIPFEYCDHRKLNQEERKRHQKANRAPIWRNAPTLVLPSGQYLQQSLPIIEYLNKVHPTPNDLFPGDEIQKTKIKGFCSAMDTRVYPFINYDNSLRYGGYIYKHDDYSSQLFLEETFEICLENTQALIAQFNKGDPFIFGDKITVADIFFYPQMITADDFWPVYEEDDEKKEKEEEEKEQERQGKKKRVQIDYEKERERKTQIKKDLSKRFYPYENVTRIFHNLNKIKEFQQARVTMKTR